MRVLYITGKGGTGKSVIASATALHLAELGYETLLLSSDPAHSLRDALGVSISTEPTKVIDRLYAQNIDPVKEASEHYASILDYIASVLKARGLDEIIAYEIAAIPGMTGVATLLKLASIYEEGRYDVIVIDTTPSGEALKYLYLPTIVGKISRRLMKLAYPLVDITKVAEPVIGLPTPSKEIVKKELEIIDRMDIIRDILLNHDITSLRLVTNPDSFSVANTRRTYIQATLYGLNTDLIIINKILPAEESGPYFKNWVRDQEKYIKEVEAMFHPIPVRKLKLFDRELKGLDMLRMAAIELYKDDDPSKVYYKGRGIDVKAYDGRLEIIIPVSFISKSDLSVERIGDELIVRLKTDMGPVMLVIPLPVITFKMSLERAKFINNELHLFFRGD